MTSMSPSKQKLLELEKTYLYVFHGSGLEIEEFEPRQAFNYEKGVYIPDGEPAIFASSVAEYSILMAIINEKNCPVECHSSAGSTRNKNGVVTMNYGTTENTFAQLSEESSGWVYVFDKKLFKQRDQGGVEYVSVNKVIPSFKIKVKRCDLPQNIEVK